MLNRAISAFELEEVEGGAEIKITYKHFYLDGAEEQTAKMFLSAAQIEKVTGMPPTITSYFHEVGVIFDLEGDGKTVNWQMFKDVPDELEGTYDPNNGPQVAMLPGRVFWKATGVR